MRSSRAMHLRRAASARPPGSGSCGLQGVICRLSRFEKAVAGRADYDRSWSTMETQGDSDVMALYEGMAIDDIRHAADTRCAVYEVMKRHDGYVSLEVSTYLAMDGE